MRLSCLPVEEEEGVGTGYPRFHWFAASCLKAARGLRDHSHEHGGAGGGSSGGSAGPGAGGSGLFTWAYPEKPSGMIS